MLTENYYVNSNSIHICFPIKIEKKSNKDADIDSDIITVNNFFAHWVKEVSVTKYGSDKELPPHLVCGNLPIFWWNAETFALSRTKNDTKKILLYSKKPVYFAKVSYDRRNYKSTVLDLTGLSTADATKKR